MMPRDFDNGYLVMMYVCMCVCVCVCVCVSERERLFTHTKGLPSMVTFGEG